MKRFGCLLLMLVLPILFLSPVPRCQASGFFLREQSAAALGNAFAGATAGAEDVTYMFFNPAALGWLEGNQAAGVVSFIAPQAEFRGGSASTVLGTPISGSADRDDIASDAFLPALYGAWALTDTVRLGLGVNAPFGLETEYDRSWIGRYHAVHSQVKTVNLNPAVAWRVHRLVSLAIGFQAQYLEAELTNALDFGTIGTVLPVSFGGSPIPGAVPGNPAQDGFFEVEGDDWGYGWNAGVIMEPWQHTRLGLAYRSKIDHTLEGDADFTVPAAFAPAFAATGLFRDTRVEADLTTPENWSFGAHHQITDHWAVMAEAAFTRWSRLEDLVIEFDNPAQPDNVTEEDWHDTWFYALGVTFRPADAWTVRAGVAHDETPVPARTLTPRVPDADRTWLSVGAQWRPHPRLALDAGYTHIWVEDSELELRADAPGNTFRGALNGSYDNAIDLLSAQILWAF